MVKAVSMILYVIAWFPVSMLWLINYVVMKDGEYMVKLSLLIALLAAFPLAAFSFVYGIDGPLFSVSKVIASCSVPLGALFSGLIRDRFKVTHEVVLYATHGVGDKDNAIRLYDAKFPNQKLPSDLRYDLYNLLREARSHVAFYKKNFDIKGSELYDYLHKKEKMLDAMVRVKDAMDKNAKEIAEDFRDRLFNDIGVIEDGYKVIPPLKLSWWKRFEVYTRHMLNAQKK